MPLPSTPASRGAPDHRTAPVACGCCRPFGAGSLDHAGARRGRRSPAPTSRHVIHHTLRHPRQCPGVARRVAQSKAASDQAALANPRWLAFVCWSQTASADRQAPLGRSATSFDRAIPGVPLGTQAKVAPCAVNDNPPPCALLVSKDGLVGPTFLCNVAAAPTIEAQVHHVR